MELLLKLKQFKNFSVCERWVSLVFWLGAIFYLSSQPGLFSEGLSIFDFIIRKLAHAFEFGILAWLIYRVLSFYEPKLVKYNLIFSLFAAVIFAALDEFHQTIVYGRFGVWTDVVIDSIGILIAVWLIVCFRGGLRLKFKV